MALLIEILFELVFAIPALRAIIFAVIPALLLLRYVRAKDRLEPESPKLIWGLVALGAGSVLIAMALETGGLYLLTSISSHSTVVFGILHWILIVGFGEEITNQPRLPSFLQWSQRPSAERSVLEPMVLPESD